MRAVKCPVSDVTANTASSQGQLKEELLIRGQHCCIPSTTCRQGCACHLQTTGSMEELFPVPITGLSSIRHLPLSSSVSFCVFVCLFSSVSMLALLPLSPPSLFVALRHINMVFLHLLWQTQASTLMQLHKYSNSFSPRHWLVTLMMQEDSFMSCS